MESNNKGGAAVQTAPAAQDASAPQTAPVAQEAPAAQAAPVAKPAPKAAEPVQMAPLHRTWLYTFIVYLYWLVAKVLYFIRFEGRENITKDRNVIMMGNHQHLFDPLALALCARDREIHFMGKKELWNNKILAWAFTKVHGFPVDRGNMDMAAIRTAMGVLKEGNTLGIFPEGTRHTDGHMGPMLSGCAMLALRSGCDVVPVYIDGNYKPFRRITVRVGKPVPMDDLRAGRINKDSFDVLMGRVEEAFFELSGGKSRAPKEAANG